MLHEFRYSAPRTRGELFQMLTDKGAAARPLAGGTDLLVNIRNGIAGPSYVVDLKRIPDYAGLAYSPAEGLIIRPACTINELLQSPTVRSKFSVLAACAAHLASYQVRNRATVIGNVVNASPCSDMAPGLLCLDAVAVIASSRGEREVSFRDFFTGVKRTVLKPDEVLDRIVVPPTFAGARSGYHKLKRIAGHDLGVVGVALVKHQGRMRLGISSAAPTPVFVGDFRETATPTEVIAAASKATSPISDVRCTREYREYMIRVFVDRLLKEVA